MSIKIYTIAELKEWMCEGKYVGLNDNLLSNARAL